MSDLKLFKLLADQVTELPVSSMALEKSLQSLIEKHLDTFLGVTFLASEYSTGPKTGGRMDTLGIDANGAPVIIEYKKATNANVINQGLLFYINHPDPASVAEKGFARDVTTIGHFGTGNLELTLASKADVEKARHLIEQSYEAN
jgi:predicted transport protein